MTAIDTWITNILNHRGSARSQPIVGQVDLCVAAWQLVAAAIAGAGTVTSVGLALPTNEFTVTNSPVTTTGTLTGAWKSQNQNLAFASPDGIAGMPSFRALVAADIPSLSALYLPLAGGIMTGAERIADGSAAAPGLAVHAADTGFYYEPSDTRGVVSNPAIAKGGVFFAGWEADRYLQVVAGGGANSFDIRGENTTNAILRRYSNDTGGAVFTGSKARGTIAVPAVPVTNDIISDFAGQMFTSGTTFNQAGFVRFICVETSPVDPTHLGTQLRFDMCPIGSGTIVEVARLDNASGLSMFGANIVLDANRIYRGRIFTVATLPTPVEGMYAGVSDATLTIITGLGLAPVGGGANHVPVYADNAGWKTI